MLFPTYEFLGFFFIFFTLAVFLKKRITAYKYFILFASIVLYLFWGLNFFILLVIDILINYYILTKIILKSRYKQFFFVLGILVNLIYLGIFKYYNFFLDSLFQFLNAIHIQSSFQVLQIIAPVGISFYTFRILSHLIDCYKNRLDYPPLLDYAVYITYFPQISSGPLSRAEEFYKQLNNRHKHNYKIEAIIILIISGLFKKYTLSSFLFKFTQLPFNLPELYSSIDLILAALAYSCLIYVDFSGYSDLSNAISSLFGFKPIQNFNMPYRSLSLQEFWQRWHISLSEWLRDYLYIPLGGNRKGKLRKYFNLLFTMIIGGLWHGAGVNFIIWGTLHGFGLIINHLWKELSNIIIIPPINKLIKAEEQENITMNLFMTIYVQCNWLQFGENRLNNFKQVFIKSYSWILTFCFVTLGWIFFNTNSYDKSIKFIVGMINFHSEVEIVKFNVWQLYVVFIIIFLMNFAGNQIADCFSNFLSNQHLVFQTFLITSLVYIILRLGPDTVPPFIYFNF